MQKLNEKQLKNIFGGIFNFSPEEKRYYAKMGSGKLLSGIGTAIGTVTGYFIAKPIVKFIEKKFPNWEKKSSIKYKLCVLCLEAGSPLLLGTIVSIPMGFLGEKIGSDFADKNWPEQAT